MTTQLVVADEVKQPLRASSWTAKLRKVPPIIIVVVALTVLMTLIAPNFLTAKNFLNLLDQNAPLMILALGTTFVIIAGGFDLSSGQILSVCGVLAAKMALLTGSPGLGLLVGLLAGIPFGMLNGALVGWLRINSFLATLATGLVLGGLALLVTQGFSLDLSGSNNFRMLGAGSLLGVPNSVWLMMLTFVALTICLSKTVLGRHVFGVGSNEQAAFLSGISVVRVRIAVYAVGGLTAALAGLILVSRTGVGNVYAQSNSITLSAIAAVVIGGTSITGGRGAIWRTLVGVLLLALMQNAFNLLSLPPYWQQIASGGIIIAALILNGRTAKSAR
jgi:ribose transport system permease protein